jgi:hypothetical protein
MKLNLNAVLGVVTIAGMFTAPLSHAAAERKPCGLSLDTYQESGKVAEFKIALRCDGDQKEAFPLNEPLVIGLTATTSATRENDLAEIEHDFPVQNTVILQDTKTLMFTFHAQLADIVGKTHVYGMVWPRSFLQDCAGGRSGCKKFGYALARPASLSTVCITKDQSGDDQISDDLICRGSTDYRFKFR